MRFTQPTTVVAATALALGGAPSAPATGPVGPLPGVYRVFEQSRPTVKVKSDFWVLTADCGPGCLRVFSGGERPWAMDLHIVDQDGTQVWQGSHWDENGLECANPQIAGKKHTRPFQAHWVIRPNGTGFVEVPFSPKNPDCDGGISTYRRDVRLVQA